MPYTQQQTFGWLSDLESFTPDVYAALRQSESPYDVLEAFCRTATTMRDSSTESPYWDLWTVMAYDDFTEDEAQLVCDVELGNEQAQLAALTLIRKLVAKTRSATQEQRVTSVRLITALVANVLGDNSSAEAFARNCSAISSNFPWVEEFSLACAPLFGVFETVAAQAGL